MFVDQAVRAAGIRVDAIFSSELARARRTAQFYAQLWPRARLEQTPLLNEVHYGELFSKPKSWVTANVKEYKTDPDFVFPGGESFCQMRRRNLQFIGELDARETEDTLLLVVHAGVVRGLICHFLGLPYAPNLKRKISHRYVGDFLIEGMECLRYDELGKPSGFVRQSLVTLPWVPPENQAKLEGFEADSVSA